jgi:APA family basic amino acid/polyamine antiporter
VIVAYLTVNLAFLDLLGFEGAVASKAIGADAARAALEPLGWGELGARFLALLVVVSSLGIVNTICLAPPYVLHAMAREGLFFRVAGALHARTRAPVVGVLAQGLQGIVLLVVVHGLAGRDTLGFLVDGVVFVDWLFFFLCGAALLRLRRSGDAASFRAPFGGVVAALFTLLALAVTAGALVSSGAAPLGGFVLCAVGLPFYLLFRAGLNRRP